MNIVSDDCTLPPGGVIASTDSSPSSDWDECDGGSGRPTLTPLLAADSSSTIELYFYTNNTSISTYPEGTVLGWAGSLTSPPTGWAWCDGGDDPELPGVDRIGSFNPRIRMIVKT